MFAKFFESELAYLRERGNEFAAGPYQAAARLHTARGGDPDVERLLEGFAFLTARIRERLDDAVPELVENLVDLLLPHMLRPLPATAIVQFSTNLQALRGVQRIPRGRPLEAPTRHGTTCRFRTTSDVDLLPVELVSADLDRANPGAPSLTLRLHLTEAGRKLLGPQHSTSHTSGKPAVPELRFFLAGDPGLVYGLRLLLLGGRCKAVRARLITSTPSSSNSSNSPPPLELGPGAVVPVGLADDDALVPWPSLSHPGLRLVQEYLFAPEKFWFFAVRGPFFADARGDLLELRFQFESPDPPPDDVGVKNFLLHCTPAVNLFEVTADPIRLDPLVHEHRLHPAGLPPAHAEVYAVQNVRSSRAGRADERTYAPFFGYAHALDPRALYYSVRRSRSPADGGVDFHLAVHSAQGAPSPDLAGEVLHTDLLCTNRGLAGELTPDAICREPRAGALQIRTVTKVLPPLAAPLGNELYWRLLAHLSLGQAALADPATLRNLLALYDFQPTNTARSPAAHIAAIRKVDTSIVTRLHAGAPVRGTETTITLDESRFIGPGHAHLMLSILDALFADSVPLNTFNQLTARLHPSEVSFRWPARNGNLPMI